MIFFCIEGLKVFPHFKVSVLKTVSDSVLKKSDALVEINSVTAGRFDLADGRAAVLETATGKARVKIHVTETIANDVIALPRGLGHTAYDEYLAGKGVNYNSLTEPLEDAATGLDAAWGVRAKLSKA